MNFNVSVSHSFDDTHVAIFWKTKCQTTIAARATSIMSRLPEVLTQAPRLENRALHPR
jgi:hypothetical protein